MAISLKTRFIGSTAGRFFGSASQWLSIRSISIRNPEKAGIIANGIIADLLVQRLCPDQGTFLDIGAQYGAVFSRVYACNSSVRVIAIEADANKAADLTEAYPQCSVHGVAVGEETGESDFHLNLDASGYNSLVPNSSSQKTVRVKVFKLDDLIPNQNVDLIKIDVEGAELGVLRGGEKTILNSRPVIMFECVLTGRNDLGYSADLIWNWFAEREYKIYTPDRVAHSAAGMDATVFADAQQYPFRSHNYFAVPSEKIEETRNAARRILGIG